MALVASWTELCCAAERPEDAPTDLNDKPIHPKIISDCVERWTKEYAAQIGPWAYDGRNNLYATKTIPDPHKVNKDSYEEFPLRIPNPGKKFPSHFKYASPRHGPEQLAQPPAHHSVQTYLQDCECILVFTAASLV